MGMLLAYGKEIANIFELIGTSEDDITKSIAWAMKKCPEFTCGVTKALSGVEVEFEKLVINYQLTEKGKGRTDLEITDNEKLHLIIEAKKGWELPDKEQLTLYSNRKSINESRAKKKVIASMSECSEEYAEMYLPFREINEKEIRHLSWKRIVDVIDISFENSNNEQKLLLQQLKEYMRGIMTMQDKNSNWVYVVSLSVDKPDGCDLSWMDIVRKENKYFHPVGNSWPKTPVNYIAFRYDGVLQSIHYIEGYKVTKNLHEVIAQMPDKEENFNYYVYELGPEIKPFKTVRTGKIYRAGRVWAMMDTLLTSETISDARDISYARID